MYLEGRKEEERQDHARKRKSAHWVLNFKAGILGEVSGRISIEHSSAFQVCPFRVMVPTDWSVPGQGVISHCSWSWRSVFFEDGIVGILCGKFFIVADCTLPGLAAFLGLELKQSWGLDVTSTLTKTLSLWSTDLRLYSWDYLMQVRTPLSWGLNALGSGCARAYMGVVQCEIFLQPPCSSSKGVYHMVSDVPEKERSGKCSTHMANNMKGHGA